MLFYSLFYTIDIVLLEFIFRLSSLGKIGEPTVLLFISSVLFAGVFSYVVLLFNNKIRNILFVFFSFGLSAFYSVKLVYNHIFKSYLSITQIGMGMDAINSFSQNTIIGIKECLVYLLVLFIPVILSVVLVILNKPTSDYSLSTLSKILIPVVIIVLFFISPYSLFIYGNGTYSPMDIYNNTFILSKSEQYFGALTTTKIEIRNIFFYENKADLVEEVIVEEPVIEEIVYEPNKLDVKLGTSTDETVFELNKYFNNRKASLKNEYTGMFKDYNLIFITAESFSPYLIDEERTPVLYKMQNEGIIFSDYYDTICDNTSNSEYVIMTGLLPDTSLLGKGWETFYEYNSCTASKNNYLPMSMGNLFNDDGYKSEAFHNYWGNYYGRNETHPNFGYKFYYMGNPFKRVEGMPTSDLELMEQALPILLKEDETGKIPKFNGYFLTFSGHMQYIFDANKIAEKNRDISSDLDISTKTKAYVSCNQELESALEYLIDALDDKGVLENTLIVLTPDHYPYTLGLNYLSEIAGTDLSATDFENYINQYRGCLLMWNPSIKEKIVVDDAMSELDILPTLANLFGLSYDSRFMMGTDMFSTNDKLAILEDRSFITKDYYYNATDDSIISRNNNAIDENEINRKINIVKNKFTVSNQMLYNDYFRKIWN